MVIKVQQPNIMEMTIKVFFLHISDIFLYSIVFWLY